MITANECYMSFLRDKGTENQNQRAPLQFCSLLAVAGHTLVV